MMTCLCPYYLYQYINELFYIKIKQGFSLINETNHNLTTLTENSRAALVKYSRGGKVIRVLSN